MLIPKDDAERVALYQDLLTKCSRSRNQRFEFYKTLRNYYLFGSKTAAGAPYNKIGSTVETLCSFIYAPDATRFNIHLGTTAPPAELAKVRPLRAEINDQWRMTKAHLTFGLGLKWSLVFGCMLFKCIWSKGSPRPYLVEPHQFGVLREDLPNIEDQEAFVHFYSTTRTQLESDLEGNPRKEKIMAQVNAGAGEQETSAFAEGMSRLMLAQGVSTTTGTGPGGTVAGGLQGAGDVWYDYSPQIDPDDLLDMCELYVWNDEIQNYQMVTFANPSVVVYDREHPGIRGLGPFVKVAPELNCYDYFWGESFVARLVQLQDWRTDRTREIRRILAKQADPPTFASGFPGIPEEKFAGMRSAGGQITSPMPGAKVESLAPSMPQDVFREVGEIDRMFDDTAGIGHILQGKGEPGVRSKGQADLMARLGSARPKARAIVVEEAAEDLATLMLRSVQEHSKQRFTAPEGNNSHGTTLMFTAAQFTNDYEVKVDAHSSSPIFVEDRKNDAITLREAGVVSGEYLLDVFDPPNLQELKADLPRLEAEKRAQAQQESQGKAGSQ